MKDWRDEVLLKVSLDNRALRFDNRQLKFNLKLMKFVFWSTVIGMLILMFLIMSSGWGY